MGTAVGGVTHLVTSAIAHFRPSAPQPHVPTDDVLSRMGTPSERLADFRAWQRDNPTGTYTEFYREREARITAETATRDADRARVREAREQLLSGIPDPADRGAYADVPILLAGDAEFLEHGGRPGDQAHLLIEDGRAVLLLRDGAPPSALAGMLPTVQERIFARSGGLTLEGALPPGVRGDVTVRRVSTLTTDTVRVVAIPPDGPIRAIEVQVGPKARPIDVALHAGEVTRVRGWTGLVGEARLLAARAATFVGFDVISPLDRARFEAAGEVDKLGPVIEERIRRWIAVSDNPVAAARVEAEIRDQIAQLDRARRILSGELVAEPRGFVAAEGLPETLPTTPETPAADTLRLLLSSRHDVANIESAIHGQRKAVADTEAARRTAVQDIRDRLTRLVRDVGERRLDLRPLEGVDPSAGSAVKNLRRFIQAERNRGLIPEHFRAAVDRLEAARARAGAAQASAPAAIAALEVQLEAARERVAHYESLDKPFNDVRMSSQLPEPIAGWEYQVEDIRGETPAQRESHRRGFMAELQLANDIQLGRMNLVADAVVVGRQQVVGWGHKVTEHGADVISVDEAGNVFLWDSKFIGSGGSHPGSETFTDPGNREKAVRGAARVIANSTHLTPAMKARALASIENGNFTAITISSDGKRFHHPVSQVYRGGRPVP
jgi:hypothetical protein